MRFIHGKAMLRQPASVLFFLTAALLLNGSNAYPQHPVDVERYAAQGEYLQALAAFDKLPARRATTASIVAAAKSAWALGWQERATREFDRALRDTSITSEQRARLLISRGAIEFQEDRYQVAALYAEKALDTATEEGALKGHAWLLWGDSLAKLDSFGAAEEKYSAALSGVPPAEKPDVHYRLGLCRQRLGKLDQARADFENVPLDHERAPESIRQLAAIALEQKRFAQAAFWLEQGRQSFPDSFLDSWVDYALVMVAAAGDDRQKVLELREAAAKKYAPSDFWLTLLNSAAEAFLWDGGAVQSVMLNSADSSRS